MTKLIRVRLFRHLIFPSAPTKLPLPNPTHPTNGEPSCGCAVLH